ncbi:CRISPR-associated protein Cas4 [Cardiobacterium valvarum]|uniref:CRISPR-associated protein Cas4 n=1 Tax=Cardiobacterium valvarum TaxID=194702 RepID=A0A381I3J0_9GAMM|nr:Dna2/Cas4 domain-containing protein [Cardiobacterium valvarum]SUY08078.1 CRISPR-associated protein Cas4 [Cardiobacterium valvarum]
MYAAWQNINKGKRPCPKLKGKIRNEYLISLSALQHYAFCPRQCALIHSEQMWVENLLTAQGRALHERVDSGEPETRKGVRFERTVHVSAEKLGISGILDLVEVETKTGRLKTVEYNAASPNRPMRNPALPRHCVWRNDGANR